jgi:protein-tyrosine phosphatase
MTQDGKTIKHGRLFRSADLSGINDDDRNYFSQRLHVVADLRTTSEREDKVTPEIAGVRNLHLPIFEQGGHDNNITRAVAKAAKGELEEAPMLEVNREFVTSDLATSSYKALIDHIIEAPHDKAVLWHCTAGKDRTGMAALILLAALGVDLETIYEDYLETNEHLAELVEEIVSAIPDQTEAEVIRSFWIAKRSYLDAALDEMRIHYGSLQGYLTECLGIDDVKLTALKDALLN